ncbi:MAG: class I SAM-dependent methyltransferase [Phycisphaerae bacterium]
MLPRLYEDEHYVFLAKPSGLSVSTPVRGVAWGVVEAVERLQAGGEYRGLRTCYRLEKYTSGVLGLAKSAPAAEKFRELAEADRVTARFVAVVRGKPQTGSQGVGRRAGADPAPGRRDTTTVEGADVRVMRQLGDRGLVRVTCRHVRGSKVRAILRGVHAPVLGDARFDPRPNRKQSGRFYLHLERLEFEHPFSGKMVSVTAEVPGSFGAAVRAEARGSEPGEQLLEGHLEVALASRMPLLLDDDTNTYRLFNGKADGISGLIADKYADVVIVQTLQGKFDGGDRTLQRLAAWYGRRLGARAVYAKNIPHDRSGPPGADGDARSGRCQPAATDSLKDPKPIWGRSTEPDVMVREHGGNYLIRPYDGYLAGLFLDQRENRRLIGELAAGRRVLNLFAYTCSFSVAAAKGGAKSTASVDVARKFLEWGKRNFAANGIALDDHRFYCSEVFDYFKRARRQGHCFDVIVVDPPTFGRTKKPPRTFQVIKDMAGLIEGALGLLSDGGYMLVSTNHHMLSARWLREQITAAAGSRPFKVTGTPDAPPDFAGARDAAKSIWVQF